MNTVSSYKKFPLIGAVLMALAVFPGASIAEKGDGYGDRGRHDKQYSYERKKSYNGDSHHRNKYDNKHGNKHAGKSHDYNRHNPGYDKHRKHDKHWKGKQYGHHQGHAYNKHKHRDDGHRHGHARYVVNNYGHRPHHVGFDDLRFMIGLHNPNLDIVFRN